jgi:hypothetical protein
MMVQINPKVEPCHEFNRPGACAALWHGQRMHPLWAKGEGDGTLREQAMDDGIADIDATG